MLAIRRRRPGGSSFLLGARADELAAARSQGDQFFGVPMSRDGNRPRSWANPTSIKEETDWVAAYRGGLSDPLEGERLAAQRGPHSDFLPTAPSMAFEAVRWKGAADEREDPWVREDPWRSSTLPKSNQEGPAVDAWTSYRNGSGAGPAASSDPLGSAHARSQPPPRQPMVPQGGGGGGWRSWSGAPDGGDDPGDGGSQGGGDVVEGGRSVKGEGGDVEKVRR